jgi:hypothetical protein
MGLVTAAKKSGRSVSEEIEARLDRSFYLDDWLTVIEGSKRAPIIQALAAAVPMSFGWQGESRVAIYPILKEATAFIIDTLAGRPFPQDLAALTEGLKGPEYAFRVTGHRVAAKVLQDLGIVYGPLDLEAPLQSFRQAPGSEE